MNAQGAKLKNRAANLPYFNKRHFVEGPSSRSGVEQEDERQQGVYRI